MLSVNDATAALRHALI